MDFSFSYMQVMQLWCLSCHKNCRRFLNSTVMAKVTSCIVLLEAACKHDLVVNEVRCNSLSGPSCDFISFRQQVVHQHVHFFFHIWIVTSTNIFFVGVLSAFFLCFWQQNLACPKKFIPVLSYINNSHILYSKTKKKKK